MKPIVFFASMLTVIVLAQSAHARSVYLNGVDISGVQDQLFKNATVKIDANGNIYISASGYKVEVRDPTPQQKEPTPSKSDTGGPNPSLMNRYYLVTEPSPNGRAQYDFTITINGIDRKIISAGSPQQIVEISVWLKNGDNALVIRGIKNLQGGRKSSSTSDKIRVLVGWGNEDGKTVKINKIIGSVKADASKLSTVKKQFVIKAK